jgi:hypothetical protein
MKRWLLVSAAAVFVVLTRGGGEAEAQYVSPYNSRPVYSPYSRPALSPYLDLTRGGNPAANYYLGVLPELDRRAADTAYRAAILDLDRRTTTIAREVSDIVDILPGTGHPVIFLNYAPYYGLGGPGRAVIAPTTTGTTTTPAPKPR